MTIAGRIHRLEAALEAKEKFFLWLQHAKAKGGFVRYWEQELAGPLVPFEWFADEEAHFLCCLVNDVNFTILNSASTNQDLNVLAHCALDGVLRQISRPDQSGALVPVRPIPEIASRVGVYLWTKLRTLLEEALSIAAAIDEISETYLGGEDILFADSRGTIEAEPPGCAGPQKYTDSWRNGSIWNRSRSNASLQVIRWSMPRPTSSFICPGPRLSSVAAIVGNP